MIYCSSIISLYTALVDCGISQSEDGQFLILECTSNGVEYVGAVSYSLNGASFISGRKSMPALLHTMHPSSAPINNNVNKMIFPPQLCMSITIIVMMLQCCVMCFRGQRCVYTCRL